MSWRRFLGGAKRRGSALPQVDDQPDDETDTDCACQGSDLASVAEIAADQKEAILLQLLRDLFSGFCTGAVGHWSAAFEKSGEFMGEDGGAILFAHALSLARAIKSDRIGTFFFQPVLCGKITDDEILMMALLQSARRNDLVTLSNLAERMAQGGASLRIHYAAFRLGTLIEAVGPQRSKSLHSSPIDQPATIH
jgi:hypothetical protein